MRCYQTSLTNSAVRSLPPQQDSSISQRTHRHFNYALRTSGRAPGKGKSSLDWGQTARMLCLPKSVRGSERRRWIEARKDAKGNEAWKPSAEYKAQSQRPKPRSRIQTNTATGEQLLCFFMLGWLRGQQLPCLTAISSQATLKPALENPACSALLKR